MSVEQLTEIDKHLFFINNNGLDNEKINLSSLPFFVKPINNYYEMSMLRDLDFCFQIDEGESMNLELLAIVKKDGRREAFNRTKIFNGIKRACEKRPVSIDVIEGVVDRIEQEIQDSGEKEIKCSQVGERVMKALHNLDAVAYVRFASVYREFKDVGDFMVEVRDILAGKKKARKEEP